MSSHDSDVFRDAMESDKECEIERDLKRKASRIGSQEREENERKMIVDELKEIRKQFIDIQQMKKDIYDIKVSSEEVRTVIQAVAEVKVSLGVVEERLTNQDKRIDSMFKRIDAQSKEMESLRHEMVKTKDRVVDTEAAVTDTREKVESREGRVKHLEWKTIDHEARGRRNNLLFHGIPEVEREDCAQLSHNFIQNKLKLGHAVTIERAHRIGPKKAGENRPIIAKFLDFNQRKEVSTARKNLPQRSDFGVSEDLPREVREGRKMLIQDLIKEREAGHTAWIVYPCRLFVNGKEKRVINPATITVRAR